MQKVLVIGSLNMDFSVYVNKRPTAGETVIGEKMQLVSGGKGANQAYALGKMQTTVKMIGAVGSDSFGEMAIKNLQSVGVATDGIKKLSAETGKAFIEIDNSGQNYITVIPGANFALTKEMLTEYEDFFSWADAVIMQLEIPIEVVTAAAKYCKAKGKMLILDPAPASKQIPAELLALVDIAKPNETELAILTGKKTDTMSEIENAAIALYKKGVKNVLVTLGGSGTLLVNADGVQKFAAYKVKAVDTTAAGDCFLAAFISKFTGKNFSEAIEFGAKASAIAVTRRGAQSSIPSYDEVANFSQD